VNNSASAIRSAISTHLGNVTSLASVKTGRSLDFSTGFPAARVYLTGISSTLKDNAPTYLRTYEYAVEIIAAIPANDEQDAETGFQDAIDAVLDKLGTEWTLSNNVDFSVVETGGVMYQEFPFGPGVSCIITLQARTVIQ
jgi:hypothetical protein